MNLQQLLAYGTSEGVKKEWDTRGRGRKKYVSDSTGKPITFYHGEPPGADSTAKIKNDKYTVGRFFSTSPEVAKAYGPQVSQVYLKMDRPYIVNARGRLYNDIPVPKEMRAWVYSGLKIIETDNIAEWAYKNGYDGVIIKNVFEPKMPVKADDYIVFKSNQVELKK